MPPDPVILHYTQYNPKNKKLMKSQDIYENLPRIVRKNQEDVIHYWFGNISADNINENISLVFAWGEHHLMGSNNEMKNVKSEIYYSQYDGDKFSKPEKIGEGFGQLVRIDSLSNVHVFWINNNDEIVHKAKKGDKWEEPQAISFDKSIHLSNKFWEKRMCAKFDNNNVLNMVFISNGNIVLAKIKFD